MKLLSFRRGTRGVGSDDISPREEEITAVVGWCSRIWPYVVRQLKATEPGGVREADELGHRVAHWLAAQACSHIHARLGEEASPLAAVGCE